MEDVVLVTAPASVATLAVLLRGIARARARIYFSWDDFFVILSVCAFWVQSGLSLSVKPARRLAPTLAQLPLNALEKVLLATWIEALMTALVFAAAKLSVCFLYKRIFNVNRRFRISINLLIAVNILWWLGTSIALILTCIPVRAAWEPLLAAKSKCSNIQTLFLATELLNLLTEVVMVALAINLVRQLHLPRRTRVGVLAVFTCGFFTAITSIIRISKVYSPTSGTQGIADSELWGEIQMCTGIVTACLPTYRRLIPRRFNPIDSIQRWYTDLLSRKSSSSGSRKSDKITSRTPSSGDEAAAIRDYEMPSLRPQQGTSYNNTTVVGGPSGSNLYKGSHPDGISVEREVSVA